jgi:hypothetical protein
MASDEAMAELCLVCPGAEEMTEAGVPYFHLPKLKLPGGDTVVEALLCPQQHGGYATRLFLSSPVPGKGANWSVHQILGKAWHTWSWNGVPSTLRPLQILLGHLDALK